MGSDTKPTGPGALVEAAEREAHERCPLTHDYTGQTCEMPDGPALVQCDEQHAAITRAVRIARLAGEIVRLASVLEDMKYMDASQFNMAMQEALSRLRAELAKEAASETADVG